LCAAANFAEAFGETQLAEKYRRAAEELRAGAEAHLWRPELGRFVRMINRNEAGGWQVDPVIDASLIGLWYFGMLPANDPHINVTMQAVRDRLWIKTAVGGVARYENDRYHQVSQDTANVAGNPWFICTLWEAQWAIAMARDRGELRPALDILEWIAGHALPSAVLAEQVDPYTGEPLSVSPLTWSHATLVATVLEYLGAWSRLPEQVQPASDAMNRTEEMIR
jgi:GH15 family glucan-1,4-alpha-glucosidase